MRRAAASNDLKKEGQNLWSFNSLQLDKRDNNISGDPSMAMYFHGNSDIQGGCDGLQTLILMNPSYVGFSDSQQQLQPPGNNFVFLNSLPSASAASAQDVSGLHGFLPHAQYHLYSPAVDIGSAREVTRSQGLSLSLSSQQSTGYHGSFRPEQEAPSQPLVTAASLAVVEDVRVSRGSPSSASGTSNSMNVLLSSKYLKATQELLDEVVNVGLKDAAESAPMDNGQPKNIGESCGAAASVPSGDGQSGGEGIPKRGAELTTAERQEIQMKKAKLVNMLDEVEQKYKQYHHQMQIVISFFEQVAGIGSAKTYTSLALQTISKRFRCLKDAILGQIRFASMSLGEDDSSGGKIEGSSLKYVDNQIRQQRALQQLGMIQHNAWRPQRGLPERAVSVLRAWLFEHFLHPYPKDSDKLMLAKQTGLTRSQVSNWFINARVRLWKPMVEEMYLEEIKGKEGNGSEVKTSKTEQNQVSTLKSTAPQAKGLGIKNQDKSFIMKQGNPSMSTSSTPPSGATAMRNNAGFNLIGSSEMETNSQGSPKKPRIPSMNMESKPTNMDNEQMSMKFGNERQIRDGFTLMGAPTIGGFGSSYPIVELGRFGAEQYQASYSGNGVSLTLGLPHCENLSISGAHQAFLPNQSIQLERGDEIGEVSNEFSGMNTPTTMSTQSTSVYEDINIQNPKRFAAQFVT